MLTVTKCLPGGRGLAPVLLKRAASVHLDWDVRQKSRFDATDSTGRHLGVFLPRGTVVRGGDVLVAEDGSMVRVEAAPQPVLEVRACAHHGSPFDLMRAAYHLGNRHVQLELRPDCLRLEPDHVLADMLRALHLDVEAVQAPFEPEAGAYAAGHGHLEAHAHTQGLDPVHAPHAGASRGGGGCVDHDHGHACRHDGGHDHGQHAVHVHAQAPAVGSCGHGHHDAGHDHGGDPDHAHGVSCGHAHPSGPGHDGHPEPGAAPSPSGRPPQR